MASRYRKLVIRADPSCVDLCILLQPVLTILPYLLDVAISFSVGKACFYLRNTEYVPREKLTRFTQLFEKHMNTTDISSYSTIEGELQEEWRSKQKNPWDYYQRHRRHGHHIREPPGRGIAATHHTRVCRGSAQTGGAQYRCVLQVRLEAVLTGT